MLSTYSEYKSAPQPFLEIEHLKLRRRKILAEELDQEASDLSQKMLTKNHQSWNSDRRNIDNNIMLHILRENYFERIQEWSERHSAPTFNRVSMFLWSEKGDLNSSPFGPIQYGLFVLGAFWALLCWQRHLSRQSASGVHDLRGTRRRQAPTPHRSVREPTSDGYVLG